MEPVSCRSSVFPSGDASVGQPHSLQISFEGPDLEPKHQVIDAAYVEGMLSETVKNQDLSRYIL